MLKIEPLPVWDKEVLELTVNPPPVWDEEVPELIINPVPVLEPVPDLTLQESENDEIHSKQPTDQSEK